MGAGRVKGFRFLQVNMARSGMDWSVAPTHKALATRGTVGTGFWHTGQGIRGVVL